MNQKLRELRKKNNYTIQGMADMLGISKPFFSQIENNKRKLSYIMAIEIANIFKMKPDDIFLEDFKKRM